MYGKFLRRIYLYHFYFIRKYDVIPRLMDVAQSAVKEKVIRVVVATFRVGSPRIVDGPELEIDPESGDECALGEFASYVGVPTSSLCQKPSWQKVDRRRYP